MDSLTHIVFGAAAGELLLGKKIGNKGMVLGALAASLPDIDVIYAMLFSDPIKYIEIHRGYTHALLTEFLFAFPLMQMSAFFNKTISKKHWYIFWIFCLTTHILLDSFTTYGTRLFLPFSDYLVAFNNLSIIDPLYTIPIFLLLIVSLFISRQNHFKYQVLKFAFILSSCYLVLTTSLKIKVQHLFRNSLDKNNIAYKELNTTPTILNSVLWSAIAYNDTVIYTAEYSFLKKNDTIKWISYNRHQELLKNFDSHSLNVVKWFSDGNYFTRMIPGDTLCFYNIKWGRASFTEVDPDKAFFMYWRFYHEKGEVHYKEISPDNWKIKDAFKALMTRIGI